MKVDIAILGGGCAGLSLATALATTSPAVSTIVIERRERYSEDRTWCGWATESHAFDRCVRRRWSAWSIATRDVRHHIASGEIDYEAISAGAFYESALATVAASPNVRVVTGRNVSRVSSHDERASIALDDGTIVDARWAIDTIPQPRELAYPWMWQSFIGFEIEAARAGGADIPELMDFSVPQLGGVTFLYTIPFAADRALFELTCFAPRRTAIADLQRTLLGVLARRFPSGYRIVRTEDAHLPMSPSDRHIEGRIVPAGTTGGAMRPATGFAFHAIQRWAKRCASDLAAGRTPHLASLNPALVWMDRVFMSVIRDAPQDAPSLYARLFSQTNPDALVRFLAGTPNVRDIADVIAALPLARFTQAAVHSIVA